MVYQHTDGRWRFYDETGRDAGYSFNTKKEAYAGLLAYGHYLASGEIIEELGVYDPLIEPEE